MGVARSAACGKVVGPSLTEETSIMKWERPELFEIGMNAEIGGYQSDFGEREPVGPKGPTAEGEPARQAGAPRTS